MNDHRRIDPEGFFGIPGLVCRDGFAGSRRSIGLWPRTPEWGRRWISERQAGGGHTGPGCQPPPRQPTSLERNRGSLSDGRRPQPSDKPASGKAGRPFLRHRDRKPGGLLPAATGPCTANPLRTHVVTRMWPEDGVGDDARQGGRRSWQVPDIRDQVHRATGNALPYRR